MKISVLGAGAVGCMITGLIKRHDPSVDLWLLGRGAHADRMRRTGDMELRGDWGSCRVPVNVCASVADIAGSDMILLTVKSTATDEMMAAAKPYLDNAVLVSLQNGINQQRLAQYIPESNFLVGVTTSNMSIPEPGVIVLNLAAPTVVGSPRNDGSGDESMHQVAMMLLAKSRLPLKMFSPIESIQYNKIAVNALGYTSALSRSNFVTEGLLDRQWRHTIAIPMLAESFRVLEAAGIRLAHVPGPSDVIRMRQALGWLDHRIAKIPLSWIIRRRGTPRLIYSIEQDLLRGRPTEIDFVNGEIVRLAKRHGLAAPLHQLTVDIAHELERREQSPFLERGELIARFRELGKLG